jgi:hypothetical protein
MPTCNAKNQNETLSRTRASLFNKNIIIKKIYILHNMLNITDNNEIK